MDFGAGANNGKEGESVKGSIPAKVYLRLSATERGYFPFSPVLGSWLLWLDSWISAGFSATRSGDSAVACSRSAGAATGRARSRVVSQPPATSPLRGVGLSLAR